MHDNLIYIYVGSYTQPIRFGTGQILYGKGKGIYRFKFNIETGELTDDGLVAEAANPSFLTIDPSGKHLYAVNELKEYKGMACGSVSSYKIDNETMDLEYLNTRPTGGTDPCHVEINKENSHVFVSNFMSGSVCVFPIDKDGSLCEASCFIQHEGSSINKLRQSSPHAHSLTFDADNKRAFVPDLGIDKLMIYETDFVNGKLIPGKTPWFKVKPGAGPRHCEFYGDYCYLINELLCSISVLFYDSENGTFKEVQEITTLYGSFEGDNICADIHITPDGRFLYGSNRGHNSIVTYSIDKKTGMLSFVDSIPCGGETPRNFAIDPTGRFVLVCNQDTDNICVFSIDSETGRLTQLSDYAVPTPVCVKFYRKKA
mgnify:CR=1 FL=1